MKIPFLLTAACTLLVLAALIVRLHFEFSGRECNRDTGSNSKSRFS